MKANELMIGDWVLINGTPRKIQAVNGVDDEIMADDELYTLAEDRYHSEDKVDGVPLTSEILEKNGFGDEFSDEYYGGEITINLDLDEWVEEDEDGYVIAGHGKKINYVHELQHALHLCGIEKEIEL